MARRFDRRVVLAGAIGTVGAVSLVGGAAAGRAPVDAMMSRTGTDDEMDDRWTELRDKIARMIVSPVVGTSLTQAEAGRLAALRPGGVILVGDNIGADREIAPFTAAIRAAVPDRPPLLFVDQEGGLVRRIKADQEPDEPTMGAMPVDDVADVAARRSALVREYGFDVNCAPVADVAFAPDSFMAHRSFGDDPDLVADRVEATVRAMTGAGVISATKHFPGHGATSVDSHEALPTVEATYDEWLVGEAIPFRRAIEAGAPMIMLGHLMYPNWAGWGDAPATFNPVAYRVLREDLGYEGVIITDDLGMGALTGWEPIEVIDRAVDCGVDLLLVVIQRAAVEDILDHLVQRVMDGSLEEARIDSSLSRIDQLMGIPK